MVQLNVWTGTKWINIFDGNDFKNMNIDLHRVAKVVEDQVVEIKKAVKRANNAMDQANKAVDASNVNKTAVSDVEKAANEAKQNIVDALKKVTDLGTQVNKNQTDIEQTKKSVALKADQVTVDDIKKTVTDNEAAVQVLSNEVKSKVDSTTVNKIVDAKGYTTAETAQALIDQTADKISGTITNLKTTVDKNGKLISSTSDQLSSFTQALDGLQTTVKNKASQDQLTQLSDQLTAKVSTKDFESELALMKKDVNLRIKKGDIISQINLEAGGDGLIQVANGKGKLLLDADSVVFKSKAFIPSAAIVDIAADKITSGTLDAGNIRVINLTADNIHGGTLDVGDMNIKNLTADDITTGTLTGVMIKSDNKKGQNFTLNGSTMVWRNNDAAAIIGRGFHFDPYDIEVKYDDDDLSIMTNRGVSITTNLLIDKDNNPTWSASLTSLWLKSGQRKNIKPQSINDYEVGINAGMGAGIYLCDSLQGILTMDDTYADYPTMLFKSEHNIEFDLGEGANLMNNGTSASLFNSSFRIQKNNKVGAYFGDGKNGDVIDITAIGGTVHHTDLTVDTTLHANDIQANSLHVTGYKHVVVKTTQGYVGINAYETAEYYFGDIGEANTGNTGEVIIGIDKIFNETVNTKIQYQVFVTPYSDCHIWVERRYDNRFIVRSDQPNAEFGWELKAKRKGYESDRLRHIDGVKEKEEIKL